MAAKPLLYTLGSATVGGFIELTYGSSLISSHGSQISAMTPAILIGTGFWALMHGFEVGKARSKYSELAKKDGEVDVDERYSLPNLYAQGTSNHAKAFNCAQRSHQHIFETYTLAVVSGIAGAVTFPICSSISSLIYGVGRYYLSRGYLESEGDASKRYVYAMGKYMWYGLLGNAFLGTASCIVLMTGGKKK